MKSVFTKGNTVIAIYVVLLCLITIYSKPEAQYPITLRLFLFGLAALPLIFSRRYILFSFTCLYTINSTSFCRILPSDEYYYVILIALAFIFSKKTNGELRLLLGYITAIIPFYLISGIYLDSQNFLIWWISCLFLTPFLDKQINTKLLAFSFPVASLVLSILFLLNQAYFQFSYEGSLDRSGWINANQFCGIVGIGTVVGLALLLRQLKFHISFPEQTLLLSCVVISYFSIVLSASRGAFIGTSLTCGLLLIVSNVKVKYKIIACAFLGIFVIYLLNTGAFELLTYRLESDDVGSANGRADIWTEKLSCYFEDEGFLKYLIGDGGRAGAERIGKSPWVQNFSTHNDYVTCLIGYGIPCFLYFLFILIYPVFCVKGHDRTIIAILTLYLTLECFVLEPLFRGYVGFIMYYILLLSYSRNLKKFSNRPIKHIRAIQ